MDGWGLMGIGICVQVVGVIVGDRITTFIDRQEESSSLYGAGKILIVLLQG